LAVNERTIRDWFKKNRLTGVKIGTAWCISQENSEGISSSTLLTGFAPTFLDAQIGDITAGHLHEHVLGRAKKVNLTR
jgi:hypothetical protein